ncbi:MAG TPA: bifunctional phosphopantothenoylcysteine decarboxylase/phosphopantothenate--cysteine ligase CoaBC [Lachnospiraceae bacterium]|nr:bifunctional phosphopantothenoylcysteine decarboxylase/phosphopantothenate--cysteine ligase CoaBC [Lachnospiraceae bacterium]
MKNVILGVTGSIAAYKAAELAHTLTKSGFNVNVIMTKNATEIIAPLTFERLTNNKCITDTFERAINYDVKHISLAKSADAVIIAPATANIIGKIACGIADDMLSTTVMACTCPIYISPAMNSAMYLNPIVQRNMNTLSELGYHMITPDTGLLACGDVGIGKMPSPSFLAEIIYRELNYKKDLSGKKVLITAGATCEAIDPVRYITNRSSGKMGFALAKVAMQRGADVTVVAGHTDIAPPPFVETVNIRSAEEMYNEVTKRFDNVDIVIKAAAVADYTPLTVADNKLKKSDSELSIPLKRTKDILAYLGEHKKNQFLCGFSMETENMLENSRKKLEKKNLDMICANNLKTKGAGFAGDTNVITIITKDEEKQLEIMTKTQAAEKILDTIVEMLK